jgi:SIR2-like domain
MASDKDDVFKAYQLIGPAEDGLTNDILADLPAKDARVRLQALIAEWLRMENLVVLTGAGTSVSAGGKTMLSLENAVLETVLSAPKLPASVKSLIEDRKKTLADPAVTKKLGFEGWLSFVVNALYVTSQKGSPFSGITWTGTVQPTTDELEWFVTWVAKSIFGECALTITDTSPTAKSASEIAPHLAFFSKLMARDSNLGRAHVFTLNYDTLLEQALELLGIQYFDGFTGKADAHFDPSVYGLDIYYPGEIAEGRVRRFDKFAHLYKLHGSIHWQFKDGDVRARHPDIGEFAGFPAKSPAEKATFLEKEKLNSVGILPTANKFMQTLGMPFSHLFRSFQIRLGISQTFFVVMGYGFGDEHVNRIIETALMNPSLVMLVIEPNPTSEIVQRIKRYRELGKRVFVLTATEDAFKAEPYTKATFEDFARRVMPDVQWLEDFLRLRRFEKQIHSSKPAGEDDDDGGAFVLP